MLARPGLEIALELRAARADLVGALERLHPLDERTLGGSHGGLGRASSSLAAWAASLHRRTRSASRNRPNSPRPQLEVEPRRGELTVCPSICRAFLRVMCYGLATDRRPCAARSRCLLGFPPARPRPARPASGSRNDLGADGDDICARVDAGRARDVRSGPRPCRRSGSRPARGPRATCASATARTAGPDTPPVPPPSHGSPGRRGSKRHAAQRVDRARRRRRRAPRRPRRPPPATAQFGVSFTISGLAVSGRTASSSARRLAPGRRP